MRKGNGRGSRPRRLRSRKKTAGLGRSFGAFWIVLEIRDAVDFEESGVVELRKKIVEIVWEPELNRDLVERLVGVAVLRLRGPKKGRATKS